MSNLADFFQSIEIFSGLSQAQLETLSTIFQKKTYHDGDQIVTQGEVSDLFFVILDGFVNVHRNGVFVANLGKGDYFGEAALFHDVKRTATITSNQDVEILVVPKKDFLEFLESHPEAAFKVLYRMLKLLVFRLDQTSHELQFERRKAVTQDAIDQLFS